MIRQGDVYWIELDEPEGSEPGYRHPHVVIQNNVFNASRIGTVMVCAITSNLRRGDAPGNVVLDTGEGGLTKPSVVVVSQVFTVDRSLLQEYVGSLSARRVRQVLDGLRLATEPAEAE